MTEDLGQESDDADDFKILGEPLVDLSGQTGAPEPPALLRTFLSGGTP